MHSSNYERCSERMRKCQDLGHNCPFCYHSIPPPAPFDDGRLKPVLVSLLTRKEGLNFGSQHEDPNDYQLIGAVALSDVSKTVIDDAKEFVTGHPISFEVSQAKSGANPSEDNEETREHKGSVRWWRDENMVYHPKRNELVLLGPQDEVALPVNFWFDLHAENTESHFWFDLHDDDARNTEPQLVLMFEDTHHHRMPNNRRIQAKDNVCNILIPDRAPAPVETSTDSTSDRGSPTVVSGDSNGKSVDAGEARVPVQIFNFLARE